VSRKTRFAVRSVNLRTARECAETYLQDYPFEIRHGFWKVRTRERGETTWHPGVDESWVELEMRLGHLPSFMEIVGHPVIFDVERPEIVQVKGSERGHFHVWHVWTGPARPAYKLTIYDGYRE
jgi:hypothetical protein